MANLAVQIGHVNGKAGAAYEEETLLRIVPHIEARLRLGGHQVTHYDGSLQNEPPEYQHLHDGCVFCHCDSNGTNRSEFSIGFWEEVHPGSYALAQTLRLVYELETGIKFWAYNVSAGEAHYYGNRRFAHSCKCVLIELGFVSNPAQRAFLQNNAQRVGNAVANAFIRYFGGNVPLPKQLQEEEDDVFYATPDKPARVPAYNVHSKGLKCYLDITDESRHGIGATVRLSFIRDNGDRGAPSTVKTLEIGGENTVRLLVGDLWQMPEIGGVTVKVELLKGDAVAITRKQTGGG